MTFLNLSDDKKQYVEEYPVPEGEYRVRISSANLPEGRDFIIVNLEIVDDPYAKVVTQFFSLPGAGRTPKEINDNRGKLLKFYAAFDLDPEINYEVSKPEPEGFVGREGYVILNAPKDYGKGNGEENRVNKFCVRG